MYIIQDVYNTHWHRNANLAYHSTSKSEVYMYIIQDVYNTHWSEWDRDCLGSSSSDHGLVAIIEWLYQDNLQYTPHQRYTLKYKN